MEPSSPEPWTLVQHTIPAFQSRAYRRAVRDPNNSRLYLHVNEYRITDPGTTEPKGITIIFAHGLESTKEQYEPFFSDLLKTVRSGTSIKAIFAADIYNHGQSFLLNKDEIGDEAEWLDPGRDIVQMINHFRSQKDESRAYMAPPLVGMGQSFGAVHVLAPAAWHPRLFHALVCIEPVVENGSWHDDGQGTRASTQFRYRLHEMQTSWRNIREARDYFAKSPYYGAFEPRVFEKTIKYELWRPDPMSERVTLVTPILQRLVWYMKPDPPYEGIAPTEDYATRSEKSILPGGFYRSECDRIKDLMLGIHCKTFYLWSRNGDWISDAGYRKRLLDCTGTGRGQVTHAFVEKGSHALNFENPYGTAVQVAKYLDSIWTDWLDEEVKRLQEPVPNAVELPKELVERLDRYLLGIRKDTKKRSNL
ncbi:conserved hypothetical protein [Talaromyces stipitatus ATCC 10500]|uniref:Uncharacterized protein n=1 Tax=Talaromyces stipitatus (strain ATCC 10500 / CBS 375.48 / QM 6759 / NRRL 1006) TaxID=441959 RepID=B8M7N6_TALSN|nr:uncharacterized protein TSTA_028710 [Talaromyces stipitatus ATCC 10500]EED19589.1 conserved hypothetical protein [Talaromyces stipitatus ATCC 10500]